MIVHNVDIQSGFRLALCSGTSTVTYLLLAGILNAHKNIETPEHQNVYE